MEKCQKNGFEVDLNAIINSFNNLKNINKKIIKTHQSTPNKKPNMKEKPFLIIGINDSDGRGHVKSAQLEQHLGWRTRIVKSGYCINRYKTHLKKGWQIKPDIKLRFK